MSRKKWVIVLGTSLLLGLAINLALNGIPSFAVHSDSEMVNMYFTQTKSRVPLVGETYETYNNSKISIDIGTPSVNFPNTISTFVQPKTTATLIPIEQGDIERDDSEDVLLLYDSTHPTSFATNFCKIAEFYGLVCRKVNLRTKLLTDALLRDTNGAYFRLIGLEAPILSYHQRQRRDQELRLLKSAVENGGANLLISKVNIDYGLDTTSLNALTDGTILDFVKLKEIHHNWAVSQAALEVTQEFTGEVITSDENTIRSGTALSLSNSTSIVTLISTSDPSAISMPVFVRYKKEGGGVYIDAGEPDASLDKVQLQDLYYDPADFTQIVPLMMTVRSVMGEEAWHSDHHYANLTIDDPTLIEPFNNFSYVGLLGEMLAHNFHTTIAFIPANWQKTQAEVVSLFRSYPDRFSLIQKGNNSDGYEFYKYQVFRDGVSKEYPARPLADQERDIQEGLARMEMLKNRTNLSYDPVMVFPNGISPVKTLQMLKNHNYLASVNGQEVPLDAVRPTDWDYGMYPAILNFANFPLLRRRQPATYLPFRPDIQPFFFDLFLGKPALFYSHVSKSELFAGGITAFNQVADQINQLQGGVEWQSLGTILKRLHLEKRNDDGSIDVRMFTNHLILTHDSSGKKTYHISKEENLDVPILKLTVNGQEYPYRLEDGFLKLDIVLPAGSTVEIILQYKDQ